MTSHTKTREQLQEFLKAYQELCREHDMHFWAEGRYATLALRAGHLPAWDVNFLGREESSGE